MRTLTIILLSIFSFNVKGQNIIGEWYSFNGSKILKFNIQQNQIIPQTLTFDFIDKKKDLKLMKIHKIEDSVQRGTIIISIVDNDSNQRYTYLKFSNLMKGKQMSLYMSDGFFTTIDSAEIASTKRRQLPVIQFYSKEKLDQARQLKTCDSMTKEDFLEFLSKLYSNLEIFHGKNGFDEYKTEQGFTSILLANMRRPILIEMNYNPFFDNFEIPIGKFQSDEEVSKALERFKLKNER